MAAIGVTKTAMAPVGAVFDAASLAAAVAWLGGTPVFADVDPETLNLDPADAAARVTARTVGLIGVHLYGRPFDVDAILALCDKKGLWLLEDAAQAHGARWKGRRVGGFGRLAAWSFYPTKNLGCFGDGGDMVVSGRRMAELGIPLDATPRRLSDEDLARADVGLAIGAGTDVAGGCVQTW